MRNAFKAIGALSLTAIGVFILATCGRNPRRPTSQQVREILARGAPFSENSFYACLLNGYEQGLPLKQVQAECETKLGIDNQKGFGPSGRDIVGSFGRTDTWFDPASVTASCNSGDPRVANGPDGRARTMKNYADGSQMDYGKNSWGGKGKCDDEGCYKGLTEKESENQKNDNIKAFEKALEAYKEAQFQSEMDPDDAAKKQAAQAAKEAAEKALEKAKEDPNKVEPKKPAAPKPSASTSDPKTGGTARPAGPGETPCDQALQAAREIIGECQRTGWRHANCQSLLAKMNHCPDPTLILVDPDSGYECGAKLDPEAVRQAYVERCRQLHRPTPGGPDPCEPPKLDGSGRFANQGAPDDMCHSPYALIDPESPECLGTVTIQDFGPNIQEILVWGLNKLGGPIVFIPNRNPPPPPRGPEPRPGPIP